MLTPRSTSAWMSPVSSTGSRGGNEDMGDVEGAGARGSVDRASLHVEGAGSRGSMEDKAEKEGGAVEDALSHLCRVLFYPRIINYM